MRACRVRLLLLSTTLVGLVLLLGADPVRPVRYAGKTFEEWKEEARTELKPEVRAECVKALIAFGQNGRATEAAEIILELVGHYDVEDEAAKPIFEAAVSLGKLGRPIIPQLVAALASDKDGTHDLALGLLTSSHSDNAWTNAFDKARKAEKVLLLRAAHGNNERVVMDLVDILCRMDATDPETISLFVELLDSKNPKLRNKSLSAIQEYHASVDDGKLRPIVIRLLEDEDKDVQWNAIGLLPRKDLPREIVPVLCKILKTDQSGTLSDYIVYEILGSFGPAAKEAVPVLKEKWVRYNKDRQAEKDKVLAHLAFDWQAQQQEALIKALQQIDPAEADRLPGQKVVPVPMAPPPLPMLR